MDEVTAISDDIIARPPKVSENFDTYLTGFGKLTEKIVLLMNTNRLLGNEEILWVSQRNS